MRPFLYIFAGMTALALLACSTERNPLEDDLKACHEATEEREAAAGLCEDLYEAERDRSNSLAALIDARLPKAVRESVLIDAQKAEALPPSVQAEIAIQLDRYRAVMGSQIKNLTQANKNLRGEIQRLQSDLVRGKESHRTEVAQIHEEGQHQLSGLDRERERETQDLGSRLRRAEEQSAHVNKALAKVSGDIRSTISGLEDFDRIKVSCHRDCNWKKRNRSTLLGFHSTLVQDLLRIQSEAELR